MFQRDFRLLPLCALSLLIISGCSAPAPPDARDYQNTIQQARASKDELLKTASDSPVPPNRRASMLPLSYFPIEPDYKVAAVLKPFEGPRTVLSMPTSTGQVREMVRVGTLEFFLKNQPEKLTAFVETGSADTNRLFVPFTDLTTGTETYAAGRYLDLDRTPTGIYEIDFNRAYFPFCYYDSRFDCPYPPRENRLQIPVRAGERLPRPVSGAGDQ